ncbi:uncharacterized protein LOC135698225 [Ochlerotatus camptorhynchus]|uniref:uncharacterized protein LOC135698225 n=1 Tax=Ochlerotatus camptorhynchus TaxID=644619 RepID=UPI0031D1947B
MVELLGTNYANHTHRYTDGSRSRNGVGIGIFGENINESSSLPPQCSVFSAEAAAIFRAATIPANKPILILTDSHSVIQALASETPKHSWIQAIIKYAPQNTVYTWIPGHCGVPGNKSADQLAGIGPPGLGFSDKVPLQDLQRWIAKTFREAWEAEWYQSRTTFIRKIKATTEPWSEMDSLRDQWVKSRLRTGHTKLYYNYGRIPFRRSCVICGVPYTVEHILCNCPEFQDLRVSFDLTSSIRDLLGDDTPASAALFTFLKEANLFHLV